MKIVGICACTSGIAHTYMAKQKLIDTGKARGHEITIETQGAMGAGSPLSPQQIKEADLVIIAADVKIGKERFKDKNIIEVGTSAVIKSTAQIFDAIEQQFQ